MLNDSNQVDFDKIKVAVLNDRVQDEIMRIALHDCGDGHLNSTAFEECDYARVPPAGDLIYSGRPDLYYE